MCADEYGCKRQKKHVGLYKTKDHPGIWNTKSTVYWDMQIVSGIINGVVCCHWKEAFCEVLEVYLGVF